MFLFFFPDFQSTKEEEGMKDEGSDWQENYVELFA